MTAATCAALTERRAVRKYLPQPVPEELVREVLTEARWAPSATNTQSTWAYVLTGDCLARFKAGLLERAKADMPPAPDIEMNAEWPEPFKTRQQAFFKTRMEFVAAEEAKMGIKPVDPPVPPPIAMANIFGAPVVVLLAIDKSINTPYGCFDAGLFAQSIALAAHVRGLGTCITGSNARYGDLLHELIPGTEDKNYLVAIALGYADWDAPVNRFPRDRVPVDEFATFV